MKKLAIISAALFALGLTAGAATAAEGDAATTAAKPPAVCLWTYQIDHTKYVQPRTLLFYMRGGKVWQNTMLNDCTGLNFNGFAYVTRDGKICSNMQSIIVLQSHQLCMLGDFTPYTAPAKAAPAN